MSSEQKPRRIKARIVPDGWAIEIDDQSWAEMMTALSIAIETCQRDGDQDRANSLRKLRSALSHAESVQR